MAPQREGREITRVSLLHAPQPVLCRRRVLSVTARGKHLVVALAPDGPESYLLRVHLGMHGTWHTYRPNAPWRVPAYEAHVILERDDGQLFICFRPEDVEVLRAADVPHSRVLGGLGPDLLAEAYDEPEVMRRLDRLPPEALLIDILLNQRIAAGLGNVYKSELMFLYGLGPRTPFGAITRSTMQQMHRDGRTALQRNLGGWSRTLTYDRKNEPERPGVPRYFVYGRKDEPCLRCHTPIERTVLGRHQRSCYFCPRCQPDALKPAVQAMPLALDGSRLIDVQSIMAHDPAARPASMPKP
jgi:endonuclease-8